MAEEEFVKFSQCKIKFGCKKFSQTLPVSKNFPRQIFPVRMLAVEENTHYMVVIIQQ